MRKIFYLLFTVIMIFGCSEREKNYLSDGEKLLRTSKGDKSKINMAIELFKKELQDNPESRLAVKNLAIAYSIGEKNDSAIIILTRAIDEKRREIGDLYQLRGSTKFILKDYDSSIEDCENAIKYNSGNQQIYNQIIMSKMWKNYYKDGEWILTEEDIAKLIDKVYPENIDKPSVDEFRKNYQPK